MVKVVNSHRYGLYMFGPLAIWAVMASRSVLPDDMFAFIRESFGHNIRIQLSVWVAEGQEEMCNERRIAVT
eukprot:3162608-Amphidinium_carterae.1